MQKKVEQYNVLSEIKTNANGLLTLVPHPETPSLCRLGGGGQGAPLVLAFGLTAVYSSISVKSPCLSCNFAQPNNHNNMTTQDDTSLPCWWLFVPPRRVGDNIGWDERTKSASRAHLSPQSKNHTKKIWQRKRKKFSGQDPNFNKCFQAVF